MAIFNSYVTNYQSVNIIEFPKNWVNWRIPKESPTRRIFLGEPPGDRQRGGLPYLPGRRRSARRGAGADDGAGSQHGGDDGVSH